MEEVGYTNVIAWKTFCPQVYRSTDEDLKIIEGYKGLERMFTKEEFAMITEEFKKDLDELIFVGFWLFVLREKNSEFYECEKESGGNRNINSNGVEVGLI